jgi:DNA-binding beta-propeller fold protein YncE
MNHRIVHSLSLLAGLLWVGLVAVWLGGLPGCAADESSLSPPAPDGGQDAGADAGVVAQCNQDLDCAASMRCAAGTCVPREPDGGVGIDAGPPEDEHFQFQPPVASESYVFVVNTTSGTVAKIDPGQLDRITVDSIEVCLEPTTLVAIPGTDSAVVLCVGSQSVAYLEAAAGADRVVEVEIGQPYTSMALSPDGRYAIAYFDQRDVWTDPSNSANKVAVVDLQPAFEGEGEPRVFEFAVGYRVTDVVFDAVLGPRGPTATRALVISKAEVALLELATLESTWILPRTWIDNPAAEVVEAREVIVTPDARRLLVRSYQSAELTVVDLDLGSSARVLLHGIPTDVDLAPDGRRVLVVQRSAGVITRLDLVTDLARTVLVDGVRYFDPDGDGTPSADEFSHITATDADGQALGVGQAELFVTGADRLAALLYTNVDRREEVSVLDVEDLRVENLGRLINKLVAYVVMSPGGRVALIVHRPDPGSPETDPVEREIDALNGYTLLDLPTRATFQQVTAAPVGPLAFSSTGQHAFLTLYDGVGVNELHVLDLYRLTLQMDFVPLEAEPRTVGVLPGGRIAYVSQEHPYGKVTFVDMVSLAKRAVTGFELNSD